MRLFVEKHGYVIIPWVASLRNRIWQSRQDA